MKRQSWFFQSALRRASLLVDQLVFYTLRPTHVAHASGGDPCFEFECWHMNANGDDGLLIFTGRTPPTTSDGNSTHDAYFGTVIFEDQFVDNVLGYKVTQADGSLRVSFLRLRIESAPFIRYFQVYTGIQSADGQSLSGTFQVYNGGTHGDESSYFRFPQTYSWTATRGSSQPINVINPDDLPRWDLNANESEGILRTNYSVQGLGPLAELAFEDGIIGNVYGSTPSCPNGCDTYFVRATSTDFSTMQVYHGKITTDSSSTVAVGTFVEIAQGRSGTSFPWFGTFQRHPH